MTDSTSHLSSLEHWILQARKVSKTVRGEELTREEVSVATPVVMYNTPLWITRFLHVAEEIVLFQKSADYLRMENATLTGRVEELKNTIKMLDTVIDQERLKTRNATKAVTNITGDLEEADKNIKLQWEAIHIKEEQIASLLRENADLRQKNTALTETDVSTNYADDDDVDDVYPLIEYIVYSNGVRVKATGAYTVDGQLIFEDKNLSRENEVVAVFAPGMWSAYIRADTFVKVSGK